MKGAPRTAGAVELHRHRVGENLLDRKMNDRWPRTAWPRPASEKLAGDQTWFDR